MKIELLTPNASESRLAQMLAERLPEHEVGFRQSGTPSPADVLVLPRGVLDRVAMSRGRFGYVQTVGTGYDGIDLTAATELGIWVANLPAGPTGNADSVAEHAVLLMLAVSRKLDEARAALKAGEGRWAQPPGLALLGKTACLVGLGQVGIAVARRLAAFGMRLVGTRRDPSQGGPPGVEVFAATELRKAVAEADYVVVCARPDASNDRLIGAEVLAAMKPGAILVNVARGSLVDEAALVAALREQRLGGAGLDVFRQEPIDPRHPLLALPNVVATPHIAGVTDVNLQRSLGLIAENIRRFARGERPPNLLNLPPSPRVPLR